MQIQLNLENMYADISNDCLFWTKIVIDQMQVREHMTDLFPNQYYHQKYVVGIFL